MNLFRKIELSRGAFCELQKAEKRPKFDDYFNLDRDFCEGKMRLGRTKQPLVCQQCYLQHNACGWE